LTKCLEWVYYPYGECIKVETLQFFEDRLGKEEGRKVAEVLERAYEEMEKKAESLAIQKKLELKDELTKELATKEDIARLEGMIQTEVVRLEGMIKSEVSRLEGLIKSEGARIDGKIMSLEEKINRLEDKMESEIQRLEEKVESEIQRLEDKINSEIKRLEEMIKSETSILEEKIETETQKIAKDIIRLEKKTTVMFGMLFFVVIFLNQNALELIIKIIQLVR
jgi:DNA anti-recombination protein RmuC